MVVDELFVEFESRPSRFRPGGNKPTLSIHCANASAQETPGDIQGN